MKISATLYSRCRPGRQDKESVEQQQQGGYDRYEEQQLWEKVDEELFVCKQLCICLMKVDFLIVYLVDVWNIERQFSRESLWKDICIVTQGGLCFECLFLLLKKEVKNDFLVCVMALIVLIFLTDKKRHLQ